MAAMESASIEAEITLLSTAEGGRTSALVLDHPTARYRPHIVVGDAHQRKAIIGPDGFGAEEYLGVQFRRTTFQLLPGDNATVWLDLMYYPSLDYRHLLPGATFTIREGAQVVGFGKVLQRTDAI